MDSQEELLETIMELITYGGSAKNIAMEAISEAKKGNFDKAKEKISDVDEALENAHKSQTKLLTREASGDSVELSLLLVHGQDHLMNAITFKDIAIEIIDIHQKLDKNQIN